MDKSYHLKIDLFKLLDNLSELKDHDKIVESLNALESYTQISAAAVLDQDGCLFAASNSFKNKTDIPDSGMNARKKLSLGNGQSLIIISSSSKIAEIEKAFTGIKKISEILILENVPDNDRSIDIIFQSEAMHELIKTAYRIASSDSPVLITGESGTGKELIAGYIHQNSSRAEYPMIAINCAALPENLLEVELFGFVKGSFTDANEDRKGKLELAENGTLFLDEIGEMPPVLQGKIYQFIESGQYHKIGSNDLHHANVRILTATNRNLKSMIRNKSFKAELFYRISVFNLTIPPLRERVKDIKVLAEHFLMKYNKGNAVLSSDALSFLMSYNWPGNVRELENMIERVSVFAKSNSITKKDLTIGESKGNDLEPSKSYKDAVNLFKKQLITSTLKQYNNNQTQTALALGLQRTYLAKLIADYNINSKE